MWPGIGNPAPSSQWGVVDAGAKGGELRGDTDTSLTMETQVFSIARSAFYHLQLVSQQVSYLTSQNLAYSDLCNGQL